MKAKLYVFRKRICAVFRSFCSVQQSS